MTLLWLIVWVLSSHPPLHRWNDWMVGLAVCLVIDVLGLFEGHRRHGLSGDSDEEF